MDKYVHWSRFTGCKGAEDFKAASGVFDTAIFLALVFHIIEWVRVTIMITTILVGVPWLLAYNLLSLNAPFGFIISIYAVIAGFSAEQTCIDMQPGRALFL